MIETNLSRVSKGFRIVATQDDGTETVFTRIGKDQWRAVTTEASDGSTRSDIVDDHFVYGIVTSQDARPV